MPVAVMIGLIAVMLTMLLVQHHAGRVPGRHVAVAPARVVRREGVPASRRHAA